MKRFDFLLHLLDIGVKPKHAVRMAKQAPKERRVTYRSPAYAIFVAQPWTNSEEGPEYWSKVHDSYGGFDAH